MPERTDVTEQTDVTERTAAECEVVIGRLKRALEVEKAKNRLLVAKQAVREASESLRAAGEHLVQTKNQLHAAEQEEQAAYEYLRVL